MDSLDENAKSLTNYYVCNSDVASSSRSVTVGVFSYVRLAVLLLKTRVLGRYECGTSCFLYFAISMRFIRSTKT